MLSHSPSDFITDMEQFFSITITFKSMPFSIFTVTWSNETVLQSKLRNLLLCSSGFLLWAGHKCVSLPLPSFLAENDLLNLLNLSGVAPSPVWCYLFTTLGKSFPVSVWVTTLYSCILDPNSGQSLSLFSALNSFLHCLFLLPSTIRFVWLGFA